MLNVNYCWLVTHFTLNWWHCVFHLTSERESFRSTRKKWNAPTKERSKITIRGWLPVPYQNGDRQKMCSKLDWRRTEPAAHWLETWPKGHFQTVTNVCLSVVAWMWKMIFINIGTHIIEGLWNFMIKSMLFIFGRTNKSTVFQETNTTFKNKCVHCKLSQKYH